MVYGLFVLFACQLGGEVVARGLGLPLPGPVIGILLLLAWLAVEAHFRRQGDKDDTGSIGQAADGLLGYLGLFFVPAGVGVIRYLDLIRANGVPLIAALIGSAFLTLIVTVLIFLLTRRIARRGAP